MRIMRWLWCAILDHLVVVILFYSNLVKGVFMHIRSYYVASFFVLLGFCMSTVHAADIYTEHLPVPIDKASAEIQKALSTHHFKVVMHIDILKRIEAKESILHIRNLNPEKFQDVQAFVFCNPVLFSDLLSAHWRSAAVCPLSLTVFGKGGSSTIVYPERAAYTHDTAAKVVGAKIDDFVISALKSIPGASAK